MASKRKNYKEDFKILVDLGNDYNDSEFSISFTTGKSQITYVCSYKNGVYKNCAKVDSTHVLCLFNEHHLKPGFLYAETVMLLSDNSMPDGNYKKVSTGIVKAKQDDGKLYTIELIEGNSDDMGTGQITLNMLSDVLFVSGSSGGSSASSSHTHNAGNVSYDEDEDYDNGSVGNVLTQLLNKVNKTDATSIAAGAVKAGKVYNITLTDTNHTLEIVSIENSHIETIIYVNCQSSSSEVILPDNYKSIGSIPVFSSGKKYCISILDGIIVAGEINE